MLEKIDKFINLSFYGLFFLVPLILFPKTSELFEFNKMILTYIFCAFITATWIVKIIVAKKIIFRRTLLDIPLLIFLLSQTTSTLLSIDTRTSIFGYYSRFHGGLLSYLSYSLLYWAFVSNTSTSVSFKSIKVLLISAFLVCIYAVLEHFGIDKNIWIQDVQNRVFSTLGQPNWLAAWIVGIIPITFVLESILEIKKEKSKINKVNTLALGLSALFFISLLYTKSRSGLVGFVIANISFWTTSFWSTLPDKQRLTRTIKKFLTFNFIFLILVLAIGTPWSPSLTEIVNKEKTPINNKTRQVAIPSSETGGTESSQIRKIVWKGAVDIWKHYPILGSGVETFAFTFYRFRPVEHNLTSEWDFLYNKAHNEYLNFAATTGTFGLISYLILIISTFLLFKNYLKTNFNLVPAFFSGYLSILITNFFGFSVVPVALLFFLYPAISVKSTMSDEKQKLTHIPTNSLNLGQIIGITLTLSILSYFLLSISRYWYADYLFATGKNYSDAKDYLIARKFLNEAIKISPKEPIFWDELSQATTQLAITNFLEGKDNSSQLAKTAELESRTAISLSPFNVNLKRSLAQNYTSLSQIDPNFLESAKLTLEEALTLAPTDAKLMFNLGLVYARLGNYQKAEEILQKTIEIKKNYRNAYLALGYVYQEDDKKNLAKEQFEFILKNINKDDEEAKRAIEELD